MKNGKRLPDHSRVNELLGYCPESGQLSWKVRRGCVVAGAPIRAQTKAGYIQVQIDGRNYLAHRIIWLIVTGAEPENCIDHIDGNPSNNTWNNLRDVTHAENIQNIHGAPKSSSTGWLGVSRSGCRWRAYITVNGRQRHLGCFADPQDAQDAHLAAKRQVHAGCTI